MEKFIFLLSLLSLSIKMSNPDSSVTSPLTSERIKCYQRSINALPSSTLRPTEGQLRYQQFHFPNKAKQTKKRMEKLFQASQIGNDLRAIEGVIEEDINFALENHPTSSSYGGLIFEGTSKQKDEVIMSDAYKVILAISARRYVERSQFGDHQRRYKWASVFGYDEDGEEERVKRFNMTKESAVWRRVDTDDSRRKLFSDNEAAAENAKKWAKGLRRQTVDGKDYYDVQRAPLHTYRSNFSLFATEHVSENENRHRNPSFWLYQQEQYKEYNEQLSKRKPANMEDKENTASSDQTSMTPTRVVGMLASIQKQTISPTKPNNQRDEHDERSSIDLRTSVSPDKIEVASSSDSFPQEREPTQSQNSSENKSLPNSIKKIEADNPRLSEKALDMLILKSPGEKPNEELYTTNINQGLSPTRLTRLHQEVLYAAKMHRWTEVEEHLTNSKWLAEMSDSISGQLLLHQVALHGFTAPIMLIDFLYDCYPNGVHKFDVEGNLPLHMACSAGNLHMVSLLLSHFEGGASVRNNDGMLPLHYAVVSGSREVVNMLLSAFPPGVSVCDNEGNLPLHFGASLEGTIGRSILKALLANDLGVSVDNMRRNQNIMSTSHNLPDTSEDLTNTMVSSLLVRNADDNTPIMVAIRALSGWEVIELLLENTHGQQAALGLDKQGNAPLHYLLGGKCADISSAIVLLRIVPQSIFVKTEDGVRPIEIACKCNAALEILLALVLLDLPFDLDDRGLKDGSKDGYGFNWIYLVSNGGTRYTEVIEKVLTLCSNRQKRELCFLRYNERSNTSLSAISLAPAEIKDIMRKSLRFLGRFEFVSSDPLFVDAKIGLTIFDAMDFGSNRMSHQTPNRVLLRCYGDEDIFLDDSSHIRSIAFDTTFVESTDYFHVENENENEATTSKQFCVSIERPNYTLSRLVAGLKDSDNYTKRAAYKLSMILRGIGKSILYLHSLNIVHGAITLDICGRFGDAWKLMNTTGLTSIGHMLHPSRMVHDNISCLPPEFNQQAEALASYTIDIWSFGKLMYETLLGRSFKATFNYTWSNRDVARVIEELVNAGVDATGADLIGQCLAPDRIHRPVSMDEILEHPYWSIIRRKQVSSPSRSQWNSAGAVNNFFSAHPRSNNNIGDEEVGEI